ncbi:MAG: type II toxin-antitoxin system HicB family antitoxin [Acidaminococcaceae bacterium]|nr:type II toxin-antitoxin system HicB family antitoxin [Acidaminococcaceae bacterium]
MKYKFPALLIKEDNGYFVEFPDLDDVFTQGKTATEAIGNAEDVLNLMLRDKEESNAEIPSPTDVSKIELPKDGTATLIVIQADTLEYRKLLHITKSFARGSCVMKAGNAGILAMKKASRIAKEKGLSGMSLDEINDEINAARKSLLPNNSLGLGAEWAITEQIEVLSECFSDLLSTYERFFIQKGITLKEQSNEVVKVYQSLSDDSRTLMLCHSLNDIEVYRKRLQAGREYISNIGNDEA